MESNLTMIERKIAAAILAGLFVSPSFAYTGQELAGRAKITIAQAERIALKARAGTVTDRELEKERGGSGLRYSFDIRSGGKTYEVGVDAKTGKVLESAAEGPNPD